MDRPPAIEELLSHRAWLRRLASSLVLDAARADDVVQETLLAALRRPPLDAGRPQAWLAAVARRIARGFSRGDEGRERHERGAAVVLALDEPYRTALLLRFFEELPPRAIARRTGVPVETARTRVKRGVELVRARMVAPEELVALVDRRERRSLAVALAAPATKGAALLEASLVGGVAMSSGAKLAAAALVVAAAASAGWWATTRRVVPVREGALETAAAAAIAAPSVVPAAGEVAPPIAGERTAVAGPEAGEPAIGSDAWLAHRGLAVTPAPVDGLPVEVVDAATGKPAAGVVVMQLVASDSRDWLTPSRVIELLAAPARLRRFVIEAHRTDGAGRTRVGHWPSMMHCTLVALEGQRRCASEVNRPPLVPSVLHLRNAAALEVEVVDRDGSPWRGMVVGFANEASGLVELDGPSVRTDGDGHARLLDVDLRASSTGATRHLVAAGRGLATTPAARASIDLDALPTEPIVLTVDESGAVEFELVDERGARVPFDGALLGELKLAEARSLWSEAVELQFVEGVATLDPVGLGLDWSVWPIVGDRRLATRGGRGPRSDGETVRAKLTCGPSGPALVARLVGEDGQSLADRDVDALVRTVRDERGNYSSWGNRLRTGPDGGLRIALPSVPLDCFRRSLLLKLPTAAGLPPRRAYFALPSQLPAATHDLGDVVARSLEATLAGRVVRDDGVPLARVEVEVEWLDRTPTVLELEEFGFAQASSDDDGRFEIVGWPPGRYRLHVRAEGYSSPRELPADSTIRLPARDLVLTLSPTRPEGCAVLGSVVVDSLPPDLLRDLRVRFLRSGGDRARDVVGVEQVETRGAFQWIAREQGRFDVEVAPLGNDDPLDVLARVEGVVVGDAATMIDPRLQRIVLGDGLRSIAITVLDESRRPVENALVVTRVAGSTAVPRYTWSGQGTVQLLTLQPALDIEVWASEGRRAARRGVSGPVELVVAPVVSVATTIRLEPAALAADPRFAFTVYATPDGAALDGVASWLTAPIGADGTARLALPPLPRWRLRVLVSGREGMARLLREELPQSETLLALDPAGAPASCTIAVEAAAIEAFATKLREDG